MSQFRLTSIEPGQGNAKYVARLGFVVNPTETDEIYATVRFKTGGEWRTKRTVRIDGADALVVKDAFLNVSKKGEPYVSIDGLELPRGLRDEIAAAAMKRAREMQTRGQTEHIDTETGEVIGG